MIIRILVALTTGIGGHFLNRRWDKAILFLSLLALSGSIDSVIMYFAYMGTTAPPSEGLGKLLEVSYVVATSLFAFFWLLSVAVTIVDFKKHTEPNIIRWSRSGIAGAILTSFVASTSLCFAISEFVWVQNMKEDFEQSADESTHSSSSSYSSDFTLYKYFGGVPRDVNRLPSPPTGDGTLKGKIAYLGEPAENVILSIVLNGEYRATGIVTDSKGEFSLALPPGDWAINSIVTESWPGGPRRDGHTLYSGGEEKLTGQKYHRYAGYSDDGLAVNVGQGADELHVSLKIVQGINLIWPSQIREGEIASIDDTIQWEAHPGAKKYFVDIRRMERDGSTTHLRTVATRVLEEETSIKLDSLKHVKTSSEENPEYDVEVFAFAEDGTLISEVGGSDRSFILSDGSVLVKEAVANLLDPYSGEDPEVVEKKLKAIRIDKERADAVKILVRENMIEEASELLNLIDSAHVEGEKEALQGYISAVQGDCVQANTMFGVSAQQTPSFPSAMIP